MAEIVERVARAILIAEGRDPDLAVSQEFIDGMRPSFEYRMKAVAAIANMREPTEAMLRAPAIADCTVNGVLPTGEECEAIWRAMIDAALKS